MNEIKIEKMYYENGQIESEWPHLNGEWHGIQKEWYPNGNMQERSLQLNGLNEGSYEYWENNGTRLFIDQFKSNNYHGIYITFKYE